jgi:ferredoxin
MKLEVDKDICIGCGACAAICPDVFEIDEDGLAVSVVESINEEIQEDAIDAKEGCPVNAIKENNQEN